MKFHQTWYSDSGHFISSSSFLTFSPNIWSAIHSSSHLPYDDVRDENCLNSAPAKLQSHILMPVSACVISTRKQCRQWKLCWINPLGFSLSFDFLSSPHYLKRAPLTYCSWSQSHHECVFLQSDGDRWVGPPWDPHFAPTFRVSQHEERMRRGYTHQPPPFWSILNTSLSNHCRTAMGGQRHTQRTRVIFK